MDDMVPQDQLLQSIDKAINGNFIYDLVEEKYSPNQGRPSMDPVMLIKIPFIQYLYGIRSMRQTIKEIEVNVAYRWFLGLEMMDKAPLFFEDMLKQEISQGRENHGKKPLKDNDDNDKPSGGAGSSEKEIKTSTTDPVSGWFHKGEHKSVFAYTVQTACDKNVGYLIIL